MIDYLRLVFLIFVVLHALEAFVRDAKARGALRDPDAEEAYRAKAALVAMIWILIQLSPVLYYAVELVKSFASAA